MQPAQTMICWFGQNVSYEYGIQGVPYSGSPEWQLHFEQLWVLVKPIVLEAIDNLILIPKVIHDSVDAEEDWIVGGAGLSPEVPPVKACVLPCGECQLVPAISPARENSS